MPADCRHWKDEMEPHLGSQIKYRIWRRCIAADVIILTPGCADVLTPCESLSLRPLSLSAGLLVARVLEKIAMFIIFKFSTLTESCRAARDDV